jgi:hypothetical protein
MAFPVLVFIKLTSAEQHYQFYPKWAISVESVDGNLFLPLMYGFYCTDFHETVTH